MAATSNDMSRCIDSVLVTTRYGRRHRQRLAGIFGPAEIIECDARDDDAVQRALDRVDVAIIGHDVDRRFLDAPRLRWVHCDKAGIEKSARPEVFERGLMVTGSAGRSAPALAEHVLYFMLSLAYRAADFHDARVAQRWGIEGQGQLRALRGRTVGLVGLGQTASALIPVLDVLGMKSIVYRRRSAGHDRAARIYSREAGDSLEPLLRESDFVVLACSLNDTSRCMIDASAIRSMKSSVFLINVARGGLVDEAALVDALHAGTIAGAGLDTFCVEPLPAGHPLWSAPNVLITPHVTPVLADRTDRILDIVDENAERFRSGRTLLNLLTADDIYTP